MLPIIQLGKMYSHIIGILLKKREKPNEHFIGHTV